VSRAGDHSEEERRQSEAVALLLNRVVLGLLADARRAGGFGDDAAALESRAAALTERFLDPAALPGKVSATLKLRKGGRIELRVGEDKGFHASAEVREDGYVLGGGTGRSSPAVVIKPADMEPWEREEEDRRKAARQAAKGKRKFRGRRYLRTVVAPPQPWAAEWILAAQLFDDGLIVDFTYDTGEPTEEELERMHTTPRPPMRIEDDLGTDYYEGERASYGGGYNSRAYFTFAPTVPADARVLRVTTDSGTVELDLEH
jgi:hypothetical protein